MLNYWNYTYKEYSAAWQKAQKTLKEEDIKAAQFKADILLRIAQTGFDISDTNTSRCRALETRDRCSVAVGHNTATVRCLHQFAGVTQQQEYRSSKPRVVGATPIARFTRHGVLYGGK